MPKTAFHTLLGDESELKQHGGVFKPETSSAPGQNGGVCRSFEGKPRARTALQHNEKERFGTSSCFDESDAAINAPAHCTEHRFLNFKGQFGIFSF